MAPIADRLTGKSNSIQPRLGGISSLFHLAIPKDVYLVKQKKPDFRPAFSRDNYCVEINLTVIGSH
jgi:hypothetical protein